MRTLVISDLHLGSRLGNDVLRRPEPLERLLDALERTDRLVLLGDALELTEGRPRVSFELAAPVLRAIAARLGSNREVLIVPGNHDAPLVSSWALRMGTGLRPATTVPLDATPALARLAGLLAPAQVSARYPGAWLAEDLWATHGHYLDRHLLPESTFGIARGLLGRLPRGGAQPIEYEHVRRPSLVRFTRWLPRPLLTLLDDVAEVTRAGSMPRAPRRLLHRQLSPLIAMLLGAQMQGASVPALARVAHRLGVNAERVVFGHVHRRGPVPGDEPSRWRGPGGRPQIANTGSWLYEPLLVHRATPPHPYWPGGAIELSDGGEWRVVGLLDDLGAQALRG